jgi:uncharacterized protein (TIGR02246 family)
MKILTCLLVLLVVLALAPITFAGPAEEVADLAKQRSQAFIEGNLEAWMAAYADNAVLTSALVAFRLEGKDAIQAHYANLFQNYPTRRNPARQPLMRVYGTDTTVVTNSYVHLTLVDRHDQTINHFLRTSLTWIKLGGEWKIVDQHVSRVPVSP